MLPEDNSIVLPLNKLKAETLRSMAKDLGVVSGGKKVELLQRFRAYSDSGSVTPIKRKSDPEFESPFLSAKKSKSPDTTPESSMKLIAPDSQNSSSGRADDDSPKRPEQKHSSDGDPTKEYVPECMKRSDNARHDPISSPSVIDNDKTVVSIRGFITGDDLLAMVDGKPIPAVLVLRKGTGNLAAHGQTLIKRIEPWFISAHKDGNNQNMADFKAAYGETLDDERVQNSVNPNNTGGGSDVNDKDCAVMIPKKSTQRLFEVSISRNIHQGALAIILTKGAIEGNQIVPKKDAKEGGTFWLSEPTVVSQANQASLDDVVEVLL